MVGVVVREQDAFYFVHLDAICLQFFQHDVGVHAAIHQYALMLIANVGTIAT